uniref:Pentatricopeptide repeat-containing protein n=1 Tax=Salix viminalis TaxID=40686 RepID=A0A6N2KN57_SALVM
MVRNGCAPDVHSYNILINGYCKSRRMEEAKSLLAEMSHKALPPDTVCHLQHSYARSVPRFDDLLDFARWLLQTWAFGRGIKTAQGNAREETRT